MTRRRARALSLAALVAWLGAGCGPQPSPPLPPHSFAFGVFGDGPYYGWEQGRWRRVLADIGQSEIDWLIHVGDLYWKPCSDEMNELRLGELSALPHPVVYTPGDNEWTDCWGEQEGRRDPIERLGALRRTFFTDPGRTLGASALAVESQASDTAFAEYIENVRWRRGGFVFATIHMVGSRNALEPFAARTPASDAESARRTEAALAWLEQTFDSARATAAKGVVIAFHAEIGLDPGDEPRTAYDPFIAGLQRQSATFPGPVIAIHGDSHRQRVDQPLTDPAGRPIANFTRIETYGSPEIGWLRVVIDTVAGKVARVETRKMRGWW